jgi:hypothetical protein
MIIEEVYLMDSFFKRIVIVLGTVLIALLGICVVLFVTRASAASLAEPSAPDNPINEYPSTWVIVADVTGTLYTVNTASNIVYGPFLTQTMGSHGGGLFDVAVTPNGKTALVSNFGDSKVSFVNISNPISPSFMVSLTMVITYTDEGDPLVPTDTEIITYPMFAEDIAITQDGKYGLVTDGGMTAGIVVLDIAAQKEVTGSDLGTNYANAVAIAPDGTVVVADYISGTLHSYLLDDSGNLTYVNSYSYTINEDTSEISPTGVLTTGWVIPHPVNVGIAPDGQTVILCDSSYYTTTLYDDYSTPLYEIGAYRITAPGVLSFTQAIVGLTSGDYQSVAFSATGDKAYLWGNGGGTFPAKPSRLTVLDITGPGQISLNTEVAAEIPRYAGSALFGVDSIAVINNKAYIGHETLSQMTDTLRTSVHVVDLNSYAVMTLTLPGLLDDPDNTSTGVAAIPYFTYVPFLILQ